MELAAGNYKPTTVTFSTANGAHKHADKHIKSSNISNNLGRRSSIFGAYRSKRTLHSLLGKKALSQKREQVVALEADLFTER
jgi:hypothetical protein